MAPVMGSATAAFKKAGEKAYEVLKITDAKNQVYKEMGISPLSSCLPMFIQIPIIFGLYQSIVRALAASPGQLHILQNVVWPIFNLQNLIPVNSKFLWMNLGQPERIYGRT